MTRNNEPSSTEKLTDPCQQVLAEGIDSHRAPFPQRIHHIVDQDLTSTGLVLGNPEGVEDFSGVVGDGGLGFDRVTVDGDGDVA